MAASTYTGADIISDVRKVFEDDDEYSDSQITSYIQRAVMFLAMKLEVPELEKSDTSLALTNAQDTYSLTTLDPLAVLSVKNTTQDTVLTRVEIGDIDSRDEDETGEPTEYARWGRNLIVRPLPSSDYAGDTLRIRYLDRPDTSLSTGTGLPEEYDEVVLHRTLYTMYVLDEQPDRAAFQYKVFQGLIRDLEDIGAIEVGRTDTVLAFDVSAYQPRE